MNNIHIFLVFGIITVTIVLISSGIFGNMFEGFSNFNLGKTYGTYPQSVMDVLVADTFPPIGKNQISTNDASDIWWYYPIFEVGSYDQITNNIRFPRNPDIGRSMPASMDGALYKDIENKSNYVKPLPPVPVVSTGTRVNYYNTCENLLPYRNDTVNILY